MLRKTYAEEGELQNVLDKDVGTSRSLTLVAVQSTRLFGHDKTPHWDIPTGTE